MIQFDDHTFQMGWFNHHLDKYRAYVFTKNTMECHERWVIQAPKVWGAADLILLIVLLVKRLGCKRFTPEYGAFSGGWRFPTKSKAASSLPKNERLESENGGGSLEKDILFGIHLSSSRLVFWACTIFVFDSNSMEVTEKKHTKKQLLWKKRSRNFDVSVVWGWCGEVFLFQVPIEVWPQKRGHVSGWES